MVKLFRNFIGQILHKRSLIFAIAARDTRARYIGTRAGFVWSVVNPLLMILIYWFIFSVGFKIKPEGNVPFIVVFVCGLAPWLFLADTLNSATNSIVSNGHLIKTVVFPSEILPIASLVSALFSHLIMLVVLALVLIANGISLSVFNFQFLYYLAILCIFSIGMAWVLASLNVLLRDVGQILGVALNFWFWLTPIVWTAGMLPEKFQPLLKLNPMFYIVEGYKASFVYHIPFWEQAWGSLGMLLVSLLLFVLGGSVFRALKPDFAELV